MPNQPKTPNRSIRIDAEAWTEAQERLAASGTSVAAAVRGFIDVMARNGLVNPAPETVIDEPYLLAGLTEGVHFLDAEGRLYEVKTGVKGIRGIVRAPQIGVQDFRSHWIGAFSNARLPVTVVSSAPSA